VVHEVERLQPLFASEEELDAFRERHSRHTVLRKDISSFRGECFLGIDAGSTTTKLALIDREGALLYSYYGSNLGSPLNSAIQALNTLYGELPEGAALSIPQ
jgi:activator of 2-hydroxyglutaryl-CoA dehydratase